MHDLRARLGERRCRFSDTLDVVAECRRRVEKMGIVEFNVPGSSWYRRHRGFQEVQEERVKPRLLSMNKGDVRARLEKLRAVRSSKRKKKLPV